jgi:hypothetical protein
MPAETGVNARLGMALADDSKISIPTATSTDKITTVKRMTEPVTPALFGGFMSFSICEILSVCEILKKLAGPPGEPLEPRTAGCPGRLRHSGSAVEIQYEIPYASLAADHGVGNFGARRRKPGAAPHPLSRPGHRQGQQKTGGQRGPGHEAEPLPRSAFPEIGSEL